MTAESLSPPRVTRERIPTKAERAAELQRAEREAECATRRDMVWTAVQCLAWALAGVAILGLSIRSDDEQTSVIYMWAGLLVGNAGIGTSLYFAYLRARDRGDLR